MPNLRRKLPSANALFVFEAAARCGNFTRAAQELYVSQPAVSRMLARMEDHIGVRLFERVSGGIELTENGRILYRSISQGFNEIENGIREIEARTSGVESVTLSVSTGFTTHWLMPRMSRFNEAFPHIDLRFQLISGRIGGALSDVDLGMRFLHEGEMDDSAAALVIPETLLPVRSERYPGTTQTDAGCAHGDTLIVMDDEHRAWHDRFGTATGRTGAVGPLLSFSDYAIVVQAALLGQGIAVGWLNVVSHWLAQGALLPVGQKVIVTDRRCCLVTPRNRPLRSIVENVRDWLIAEMHNDIRIIGQKHPGLRLLETMKSTGFKLDNEAN